MGIIAQKTAASISDEDLRLLVRNTVLSRGRVPRKMLLLPPDHTRLNSRAGRITEMLWEEFHDQAVIDIMPALGTHAPMSDAQLEMMFGSAIPKSVFKVHDWRNDTKTLGTASKELIGALSEGRLDFEVKIQANKILFEDYDLILSIGQVVPHEVVGLANYTKNLMVGIGGFDMINKSHFLGAISNMEKIMGRADTPVRRLYNYGVDMFLGSRPIVYMLTVMARNDSTGQMEMRGFFSGDNIDAFNAAARVCVDNNLILLDKPLKKVICNLDPLEFKSTWLGNKAVYRTRMAIADGGELIVLAPGLKEFGEDKVIDGLIRKYGYRGTQATLKAVRENSDLAGNLGAAAHMIHGSSEGRFTITYCPGKEMSEAEIRSVGFEYGNLEEISRKYKTSALKDGMNLLDGEEIFYISNPALGLWALKDNFK